MKGAGEHDKKRSKTYSPGDGKTDADGERL